MNGLHKRPSFRLIPEDHGDWMTMRKARRVKEQGVQFALTTTTTRISLVRRRNPYAVFKSVHKDMVRVPSVPSAHVAPAAL